MRADQLVTLLEPVIGASVNVAVETREGRSVTVSDIRQERPLAKVTVLGGMVAVAVDNLFVTILDPARVIAVVVRPREEADSAGHYA